HAAVDAIAVAARRHGRKSPRLQLPGLAAVVRAEGTHRRDGDPHLRSSWGSTTTVWRHNPPLPGDQCGRVGWSLSDATSDHVSPAAAERNRAASSTPA